MLNNKNENVIGGYMKKTYIELVEEISPEEIDELYYYKSNIMNPYDNKVFRRKRSITSTD